MDNATLEVLACDVQDCWLFNVGAIGGLLGVQVLGEQESADLFIDAVNDFATGSHFA